mmetsp:Transcript_1075/g.1231  ORF Transcript_1075/g.1231 Transcript_1075/m.1231 type:complete len:484 (-) Transcript_1075:43-1494(-)
MIHISNDFFGKHGMCFLALLVIPYIQTTMAFMPVVINHSSYLPHHDNGYNMFHRINRSKILSLASSSKTKTVFSPALSSLPPPSTSTTNTSIHTSTSISTTTTTQLMSMVPSFWKDGDPSLPLHESTYTQVLSTMSLTPIAIQLRQAYDNHFEDPRQPNVDRFAWDPWFVSAGDGKRQLKYTEDDDGEEGEFVVNRTTVDGEQEALADQIQYSLKRIQTSLFFPEDLYNDLVDELVLLANSIGLTAISPPWTSMYTDGDTQNFHTDSSHGPMAFVLSVSSKYDDDFQGGETMIVQQQILDFWKNFETGKAMEVGSIIRYIPSTLGQCIAFDPRVPHGVNRVTGTNQDPRRARVVIHGWFNEPEICWFGNWGKSTTAAATMLDQALQPLVQTLGSGEIGRVVGYLAARVEINEDGSVDRIFAVCDTVQADMEDFRGIIGYDESDRPIMEDAVADIRLNIYETLKKLQLDEGAEGRAIVVPFAFE